jgi:hypothetical protein
MTTSYRSTPQKTDLDTGEALRIEYDWSQVRPSTAVVETVAVAVDHDPTTIEPIYHFVDTDALDSLVESKESSSPNKDIAVTFTYIGHSVTVHDHGEVVVRPNNS